MIRVFIGVSCFLLQLFSFYPGNMTCDSNGQFHEAVIGVYTDHHPPMMAWMWHWILYVFPDSLGMLLISLACFWVGITILSFVFSRYVFLLGFWPGCVSYLGFIWKDVQFASVYFLLISILIYRTVNNNEWKWWHSVGFYFAAFYGSAVKHQAIYVFPLLAFWQQSLVSKKRFMAVFGLSFAFFFGRELFNQSIATASNSWQLARLYELSYISLQANKPIFPKYILENPKFSWNKVKDKFENDRVDLLVFGDEAPLVTSSNAADLANLQSFWLKIIFKYPGIYLKQKISLLRIMIKNSPVTSIDFSVTNLGVFKEYIKIIPPRFIRLEILLPIVFLGMFLGYRQRNTALGYASLMLNVFNVGLLLVLIFINMAANARYVFLNHLLCLLAIPLVFKLCRVEVSRITPKSIML